MVVGEDCLDKFLSCEFVLIHVSENAEMELFVNSYASTE